MEEISIMALAPSISNSMDHFLTMFLKIPENYNTVVHLVEM